MDFLDDGDVEPLPRFVVSRGGGSGGATAGAGAATTASTVLHLAGGVLLLAAAYSLLLPASQTLASLAAWLGASLLLAPFAPAAATGGDISVGRGPPLPDPVPISSDENPNLSTRRSRRQNPKQLDQKKPDPIANGRGSESAKEVAAPAAGEVEEDEKEEEQEEWTEKEVDLLRRQMAKHPAGEPGRWEKIAAAFAGRRSPESVIRTAKSGATTVASDSFDQFLRRRKPLDPRADAAIGREQPKGAAGERQKGTSLEAPTVAIGGAKQKNAALEGDSESKKPEGENWSSRDDLALLNALKAFPKEANMRWEKIAAAVPGKTKAACMKRVAELKRDFRNSKSSESPS